MTFVTFSGNWSSQDNSGYYMWHDKNVVAGTDGKSIFDPSPIGWKLAINGTWSNFSTETFTVSSSGRQHSDDHAAYYPSSGYRNRSTGTLAIIGSAGYSWTSSPSSATNGSYLDFSSTSVTPSANHNRASGFAARSIRE